MKCGISDDLYLHYQLHRSLQVFILSILFLCLFFFLTQLVFEERFSWWRSVCRPSWRPLTSTSVFILAMFPTLFFYNNLPVSTKSDGCEILKSSTFSSSSHAAVDSACSSTLKSCLRFKIGSGDVSLVQSPTVRCELWVQTQVLCWWIPLQHTLQKTQRKFASWNYVFQQNIKLIIKLIRTQIAKSISRLQNNTNAGLE